jgi:hypothetical protein
MRRRGFGLHLLMLAAVLTVPAQSTAYAGVISTEQYIASIDRGAALARVDEVLARAEVRERLERLGVNPADALARAEALSDAELIALAENLEELPAGGLLGVLGVVFVVLLILELVGVTNIFTKI